MKTKSKAQPAPDWDAIYASMMVDAANSGDAEAARDILETFADTVDRHSPRSWECIERAPRHYIQARYLADAFRAILDGVEPRKALNLTRPQGRQQGKAIIPHDELAAMLHFLVRRGISKLKAKEEIAEEMGIEPITVQRAAREWDLSQQDDELLKAIFKCHAARVTKILARSRRGQ
jgi:hypothetical protein